jgi:hypothetical protein
MRRQPGSRRPEELVEATGERAARASLPAAGPLRAGWRSRGDAGAHAAKFRTATLVLALIALAAVSGAVVLALGARRGGPAPAWAGWSPPDGGAQGARDIADHLAPLYRISGADQLDAVTVLNVPSPNLDSGTSTPPNQVQVAVSNDGSLTNVSLLGGRTIAYNLCGLQSSDCSIPATTASSNEMLLLRREGLELALFTFEYLRGVDNVVALMPPSQTAQTATLTAQPPTAAQRSATQPLDLALVFDRTELQDPFLTQPLTATMSAIPPPVYELAAWRQTSEAALIDQLTARTLYSYRYLSNPGGGRLLVLSALPPQ